MSDALPRFLVCNLGASLLATLWVLLCLLGVLAFLGIRSSEARVRLLVVPLVKSTLVLLGITTVMPFPFELWDSVQASAVPAGSVAPLVLALSGVALVVYPSLRSRLASRLIGKSEALGPGERPSRMTQELVDRYHKLGVGKRCCQGYEFDEEIKPPRVFRSDAVDTLTVVAGKRASILIPPALESALDDEELEAVLAHEIGHLALSRPVGCCDPEWLRPFLWWNPASFVVSRMFASEEELACDEIAARWTGNPRALARALLKAYRFRKGTEGTGLPAMASGFLGGGGLLKRRIERLLESVPEAERSSPLRVSLAWVMVVAASFVQG